jgi:murein DD-endopeptidase MepM/ murein hydrolase activator NlpD
MGNYALPTNTSYVSCSWSCHRNRNPCSSEPGTDYGSAYGSPLYAPANGTVYEVKNTTSGATGRYIAINLDDGRRTRSLHLSAISVSAGQRVSRGQLIGKTGASGYGSEWGYGAHVHQTLWSSWTYNFCCNCTIDFAVYVGNPTPEPKPPTPTPPDDDEENEMTLRMMHWTGASVTGTDTVSKTRRAIWDSVSGYFMEWTETGSEYANNMARNWNTGSSALLTQSVAKAIYTDCIKVRPLGK